MWQIFKRCDTGEVEVIRNVCRGVFEGFKRLQEGGGATPQVAPLGFKRECPNHRKRGFDFGLKKYGFDPPHTSPLRGLEGVGKHLKLMNKKMRKC